MFEYFCRLVDFLPPQITTSVFPAISFVRFVGGYTPLSVWTNTFVIGRAFCLSCIASSRVRLCLVVASTFFSKELNFAMALPAHEVAVPFAHRLGARWMLQR